MIALTGIVFSLAFVMVQFSATAYSPRLVVWLSRDPLLFHALGIFTATFLYSLAALAWVDRYNLGQVPALSVWIVIGLLTASVGVFIGLVQRLSRLQVNRVLAFTSGLGREVIDVIYPPLEEEQSTVADDFEQLPLIQTLAYSGPPRTIQSLDVQALLRLAERSEAVIEMLSAVGDTLVETTPLLKVYGECKQISERALRKAIRLGAERTFKQDPKYSIRLLVDIAIRALSPAVNDPLTAVHALDHIEDLLLRLGRRRLEIGAFCDRAEHVRLVVTLPSWDDFLDLAFTEIRHYGAESVQIMRRMKALLSDLLEALPEERRSALLSQQKRLAATIARSFADIQDQLDASQEDREGLGATRRHRRRKNII